MHIRCTESKDFLSILVNLYWYMPLNIHAIVSIWHKWKHLPKKADLNCRKGHRWNSNSNCDIYILCECFHFQVPCEPRFIPWMGWDVQGWQVWKKYVAEYFVFENVNHWDSSLLVILFTPLMERKRNLIWISPSLFKNSTPPPISPSTPPPLSKPLSEVTPERGIFWQDLAF